jgi:methyltransferase
MVTRRFFLGFLILLALQRILELRHSKLNETWMRASGGIEHAPGQFKMIKLLHITWFLAMIGEVYYFKRSFIPRLAGLALLLTAIGQSLRYAAIQALGRRWSVRILTLPNTPPVKNGIYKYIRHPNYAGVILEILAVPLLHSAYLTSALWSTANALLLAIRIRREERALMENTSTLDYPMDVPPFIPALRAEKYRK